MEQANWLQFALIRTARQKMTKAELTAATAYAERAEQGPAMRKYLLATCWEIVKRRALRRHICR